MGCHFLLQETFPTQGLNQGVPHCRQTLYRLSHQGSPSEKVIVNFSAFNSTYLFSLQESGFLIHSSKYPREVIQPLHLKIKGAGLLVDMKGGMARREKTGKRYLLWLLLPPIWKVPPLCTARRVYWTPRLPLRRLVKAGRKEKGN